MLFDGLPNRREVLFALGASALALRCGPGTTTTPPGPEPLKVLSADDAAVLSALGDAAFPPDKDGPGAASLGIALFTDRLLSGIDAMPADVLRGGPSSPRGGATGNAFLEVVELDRAALLTWKLHLLGSDGVPGGGPNDALLGKTKGLKQRLTEALAEAQTLAKSKPAVGGGAAEVELLKALSEDSRELFIDLALESCFSAPEYGGNKDGAGWKQIRSDGDVMPRGFSIWNEAKNAYEELPDKPVSTAEPGTDPYPLDSYTKALISEVCRATGGKEQP